MPERGGGLRARAAGSPTRSAIAAASSSDVPGQDAHERLQEDQAVVHLRAGERPGAVHGVPDRDHGRAEHHP